MCTYMNEDVALVQDICSDFNARGLFDDRPWHGIYILCVLTTSTLQRPLTFILASKINNGMQSMMHLAQITHIHDTCTYIHTYTHIHTHTYIHTYISTRVCFVLLDLRNSTTVIIINNVYTRSKR